MENRLANYSPERVNIVIGAIHTVTGFSDGSFVTIEKVSPTFTVKESADGVVSRTMNPSSLYTVRLTLAQSSDSNEVLSWMHNADLITKGRAKFPMTIKDASGNSVMFSAEAWIATVPPTTYSNNIEVREWEIVCADAVNHVGGNYSQSGFLEDVVAVGGGLVGAFA